VIESLSANYRVRIGLLSVVLAALLALGTGISSASSWSWIPQGPRHLGTEKAPDSSAGPVHERINPDGTCELVDANGVPLYDSQFSQRTGSSPCDQN
jgi:hypothetical protein